MSVVSSVLKDLFWLKLIEIIKLNIFREDDVSVVGMSNDEVFVVVVGCCVFFEFEVEVVVFFE